MSRNVFCLLMLLVGNRMAPATAGEKAPAPLVVGHRGLLKHSPENTLAGFRACLALRIGFELDVRRSQDGAILCLHDATLDRTTTGRGKVADFPLDVLKRLDAGSWFDETFRGELIPTLEEVFATMAQDATPALIAVDLKVDDDTLENDIVDLARKHEVQGRLLFIGRAIGDPDVRRRLRKADPTTHVARLVTGPDELAVGIADPDADWIYLRYLPSRKEVQQVHAADKRVFLSGEKVAGHEEANWRAATAAGVDAVLTDFPLELHDQLRRSRVTDSAKQ